MWNPLKSRLVCACASIIAAMAMLAVAAPLVVMLCCADSLFRRLSGSPFSLLLAPAPASHDEHQTPKKRSYDAPSAATTSGSQPLAPGGAADADADHVETKPTCPHSRPDVPKLSEEQERSVAAIFETAPCKRKSTRATRRSACKARHRAAAAAAATSTIDAAQAQADAEAQSLLVPAPGPPGSDAAGAAPPVNEESAASSSPDTANNAPAAMVAVADEPVIMASSPLAGDATHIPRPRSPPSDSKAQAPSPAATTEGFFASQRDGEMDPKPSAVASPAAANNTDVTQPPLHEGGAGPSCRGLPVEGEAKEALVECVPPLCAADDTEVFEHSPLELSGRDIDPSAPPNGAERLAQKQIEKLVHDVQSHLQNTPAGSSEWVAIGNRTCDSFRQHLLFVANHRCRPRLYAYHAEMAANFFSGAAQNWAEAEKALDGAIQAASMCGDFSYEAKLVNDLGSILLAQKKHKRALSLYRQHLETAFKQCSMQSHHVEQARKSVVQLLELLQRKDDAHSFLLQQAQQCRACAEQAEAESSARAPKPKAKGSKAKAAHGGKGEPSEPVKLAWDSTARCYLDLARFTSRCHDVAEAATHARTALDFCEKAHGEGSPCTKEYLSVLASNLHRQCNRSEDKALWRETQSMFRKLLNLVERTDPGNKSLRTLYPNLARICMQLGDLEEGRNNTKKLASLYAKVMGVNKHDPKMLDMWTSIEAMHKEGGDIQGAEMAAKAALKCQSPRPEGAQTQP